MSETFKVKMGEIKVTSPPNKFTIPGLGSCVALIIYDRVNKVCGMAHIMLPDSSRISIDINPLKFADKAVPKLIDMIIESGGKKENLAAKLTGGSKMFTYGSTESDILLIGDRNIVAVKDNLKKYNIETEAEDLGGSKGRTITYDSLTEELHIKYSGGERKII